MTTIVIETTSGYLHEFNDVDIQTEEYIKQNVKSNNNLTLELKGKFIFIKGSQVVALTIKK